MSKSIAGQLLEKLSKINEEEQVADSNPGFGGTQDQVDVQPETDKIPTKPLQELDEEMPMNPEMAGQACDHIHGMAERYCNEEDIESFTAQDDDDKNALNEAKMHLSEASKIFKGIKK